METQVTPDEFAIARLNKDLREAAKHMTVEEARYLVDSYYTMQGQRIAQGNRQFSMSEEPHAVIKWFGDQSYGLEKQIGAALDHYSASHPVGEWMRKVIGIGPVIAAGLLAHIDIRRAPTVGHIWRFAGLDPTLKWGKGQVRPWNADLKRLCWLIGESFKKTSGNPRGYYGKLYKEQKAKYVAKNEAGGFKETAERTLIEKKWDKSTEAYKAYIQGKLPPGRLDLMAMRWAVKQFLADLHGAWCRIELGHEPPKPYPIAILNHAHQRVGDGSQ